MPFREGSDPAKYVRESIALDNILKYKQSFTGIFFEEFADRENPGRFTPSDLLAVSMLSVNVPARAAVAIVRDEIPNHAGEIAEQLARIPADATIWDPQQNHVGPGTPAQALWTMISGLDEMGRTKTSKLLAAKRPHLFPVFDWVVGQALFASPKTDPVWAPWRDRFMQPDGADIRTECESLREKAGLPATFSVLRILDIAIWMREH